LDVNISVITWALSILTRKEGYLMANTYSQIYIQTVFAVNGRLSLITPTFKEELHKYITGIVTKKNQKLIQINGMSDHLHILIGLRPSMALNEYLGLLRKFEVEFKDEYVFEFYD
jgi:REP element-mobilizing transposase RayT